MDRMRAGLTGLGLVFVATLAASVLFAPEVSTMDTKPSEPLAQLGVAPGPEKQSQATRTPERDAGSTSEPPSMDSAPVAPMDPEQPAPMRPDAATLPALPHDADKIRV